MIDHLVLVGVLGQIGRFRSVDGLRFSRGNRVVCRTSRGLEFGKVLSQVPAIESQENDQQNGSQQDTSQQNERLGTVIRKAAPEDHLLWARIEKNRTAAIQQCESMLAKRLPDYPTLRLMDVEILFDGRSIFFYFLGEISSALAPKLEALTTELAAAYEAKSELRKFGDAMIAGCGPDCGTQEACGENGACSGCAISAACK